MGLLCWRGYFQILTIGIATIVASLSDVVTNAIDIDSGHAIFIIGVGFLNLSRCWGGNYLVAIAMQLIPDFIEDKVGQASKQHSLVTGG